VIPYPSMAEMGWVSWLVGLGRPDAELE
jgi:hypothetical protein